MADFTNDQAAVIASATMRRPMAPSAEQVIRDAEVIAAWLNRRPPVDHVQNLGDNWLDR